MPSSIDSTTQTQASASKSRPILLFEFYLTTGTQFFNSGDREITYGGNTYYPYPLSIGEVKKSVTGLTDDVSIVLSNVTREISALLLAEKFRGKQVIIRRSFILDDGTASVPFIVFDGVMNEVVGKEEETSAIIQVTCTTDLAYWEKSLPGRQYQAHCQNQFKDVVCAYAGVETWCNKTWARCVVLNNTPRYTGFRHLPRLEQAEIWWGKDNPVKPGAHVGIRVWS